MLLYHLYYGQYGNTLLWKEPVYFPNDAMCDVDFCEIMVHTKKIVTHNYCHWTHLKESFQNEIKTIIIGGHALQKIANKCIKSVFVH